MSRHSQIVLAAIVATGCATNDGDQKMAPQIRGQEVTYRTDGVELRGYLAYDAAQRDRRPGVLVVHEWWGHNEYVRRRARMLAELGYVALAVDMYGDGKQAAHPDDAQKFMMEVIGNLPAGEARFNAGLAFLKTQPQTDPQRIAAIGYCFGGAVVLHMARTGADLAGVASFHGNLGTEHPAQPGGVKAKILVEHGAADPFVPPAQVEAFRSEMAAAGATVEFHAYPGVKHAFTNPDATAMGTKFGLPLVYDAKADAESWKDLQRFLRQVFGG